MTLEEAKKAIEEITIGIKRISIEIADENKTIATLRTQNHNIKLQKRKRLLDLQKNINNTKNQVRKERERKNKQSESESYNRRIVAKDKEILKIKEKIATYRGKIANGKLIVARIRVHLKNLKK